MKLFGLTGGIGMGKSTSHQLLQQRGVSVIDTDQIARDLVEPGRPALDEISRAFGPDIIGPGGRLRRGELAGRVFADTARRADLEAILHPKIRAVWQKQVADWRAEEKKIAIVVIPLLFETDAAASFDAIICVACSAASQHARLQQRGWSDDEIANRIASQWPVQKKMDLSNYVIWTEGSLDSHAAQLAKILPAP